jgi:hypothetical protein
MHLISKGSKVYYSELGHNNFFYPSNNFIVLTEDVMVDKLNWIGSNRLKACKIQGARTKNVVWTQEKNILHLHLKTN